MSHDLWMANFGMRVNKTEELCSWLLQLREQNKKQVSSSEYGSDLVDKNIPSHKKKLRDLKFIFLSKYFQENKHERFQIIHQHFQIKILRRQMHLSDSFKPFFFFLF